MTTKRSLLMLTGVLVLAFGLTACKSSGVAVSDKGHIIAIDIEAPATAPADEVAAVVVKIMNRGFTKLKSPTVEVVMPTELMVVSQTQTPGVTWTERITAGGLKLYAYTVNEIDPAGKAELTYHVRTTFGNLQETGKIEVTVWEEKLPGGKLVETRSIRLQQ
jgi:hypothetical protein